MAGIHQFGRIGARAMIGAGAMMSHDAPPFAMVQGDRARLVGVNKEGLKRGGFSAEEIAVIKRVYRLLFWRDGVLENRIAEARRVRRPERARRDDHRLRRHLGTRHLCDSWTQLPSR